MFVEDMDPRHPPRTGWAKDSAEVEGYVRGFARRRPDVTVTTFRYANFIDSVIDTAMTEYFRLPVIPTVMGFDPRLQFIHVDDGLEILRRGVLTPSAGTYNVAGDGVMTLMQCIRRTGRPYVPVPELFLTPLGQGFSRFGLLDFSPEQVRHIMFGRVLDTTLARETFDFVPERTTEQAFWEFAAPQGGERVA